MRRSNLQRKQDCTKEVDRQTGLVVVGQDRGFFTDLCVNRFRN